MGRKVEISTVQQAIIGEQEIPLYPEQHTESKEYGHVAREPPRWAVVQEVEGQQIPEPNEEIKLTAHGRRLIGYRD